MVRKLLAGGALLLGVAAFAVPVSPGDRLVKVYGDLATADRIAIIVPGTDTTAATFDNGTHRPGGAARALLAEARRIEPGTRLAVVAWLGYDSPPTWSPSALTDGAAADGARELRARVLSLPGVPVALLCHSYGSVVCARAAPGLPVADLAVFGSPGLGGARTAAAVGTRVWAGRGAGDWISNVPHLKIGPVGFGTDPMDPAFGARIFATGPGGHSDYFDAGTASLRNLALIALGRGEEVRGA
ncbi:alpha/beta hydrolase [Nonomuraea sp. NPDC059194]|uniref:alpha/beta hydrolase n=1 Tax=Nonomuraea sp. NPDC059194 TaxID=3346764 RepID=UPI00369369FA